MYICVCICICKFREYILYIYIKAITSENLGRHFREKGRAGYRCACVCVCVCVCVRARACKRLIYIPRLSEAHLYPNAGLF